MSLINQLYAYDKCFLIKEKYTCMIEWMLRMEKGIWGPSQYKDGLSWYCYFHYEDDTVVRQSYIVMDISVPVR